MCRFLARASLFLQCDIDPLYAFAFAGAPDDFAFAGECGDADVELPESVFSGSVEALAFEPVEEDLLREVFEPSAGAPEDDDFASWGRVRASKGG